MKKTLKCAALFFVLMGLVHSAGAWTSDEYAKTMRTTVAQLDAYYSDAMKKVYASEQADINWRKNTAQAIQEKWAFQRDNVVRDMRQIIVELKFYESRDISSSMRIRARMQQALGEVHQWHASEMSKIPTLGLPVEEQNVRRSQINQAADVRTSDIQKRALHQENALRELYGRANKPMFVLPATAAQVSSFALKYKK